MKTKDLLLLGALGVGAVLLFSAGKGLDFRFPLQFMNPTKDAAIF